MAHLLRSVFTFTFSDITALHDTGSS